MSDFDLSELSFLIAEDNRFMLSLVRQQLRAFESGEVHEALDGGEAFEILCSKEIDIAIIEYGMSPVDGLSFVRHVRTSKQSPNPELPILMMAANVDMEKLSAVRDIGATEILAKPVSAKLLYDRIQYALQNGRQFVRSENFVGPDRRRRHETPAAEKERRQS